MNALLALTFGLLLSLTAWTQVPDENPLQAQAQLVPIYIEPQQGAELRIQLKLPDKYHAYAEHFALKLPEGSRFQMGSFKISPETEFYDENSKKKQLGVRREATLTAPIEAPADLQNEKSPLHLKLTYQACTKKYCLFPKTIDVPVEFSVGPIAGQATEARKAASDAAAPAANAPSSLLQSGHLAFSFLMIFLAGILTSLTPCIFPMIPITLAVLGRNAHARSRLQNLLVSVTYVLGLAFTYSCLGLFAATTGALFGSFMSSPWVLGAVCIVFLAMSLSMFGLFDLDSPTLQNKLGALKLEGYPGAFITGMIAGVVAGPCVGPVLVGILTSIAQTKNLFIGFWALFVFALGMGMLFLVLGISSSATKLLPKSGAWMEGVKHFFGVLMLGAFYYYLRLLVPMRAMDGALAIGLILLGSLRGAFEHPLKTGWEKVRKGICQAIIIIGAFYAIVAIFDLRPMINGPRAITAEAAPAATENAWQTYSEARLAEAKAQGKPVIIDFGADWCAACKELVQYTFDDPQFQSATKDFVLLRFDATNDSPEMDALKAKYEIVGLPTVVFYDSKGNYRKELTLTAFEEAPEFLKRVEKIKSP